jgi:phage major head subunit gpT-like protein
MSINSGNYGRLLEPGLRKIFFDTYQELPEQFSQIYNIMSSKKAVETDLRMGGFSKWGTKDSLGGVEYENPTETSQVLYKHVTFAKGFQVEKEMVDDEQYSIINKYPKALARAARVTLEEEGASTLNKAFSNAATSYQNPYKNEALIGNHTRLDGGTTTNILGTTASPVGTTASGGYKLDEFGLRDALNLSRQQVDERGMLIQMNPDILIVPPELEFQAMVLNNSTLSTIPGGQNGGQFARNDVNTVKGRFKIVVMDYLSEYKDSQPGAIETLPWFLMDSKVAQLNWFWREKLSFKNETDFDTDVAKYKGRMRFSYGWSDHRGIIGTIGVQKALYV